MSRNSFIRDEFLTEGTVTPESLLEILEGDTSEIETIEFIPPNIGSNDFGRFRVKWEFSPYNLKMEPTKMSGLFPDSKKSDYETTKNFIAFRNNELDVQKTGLKKERDPSTT